jgi:hypothetical protein
MTTETLLLATLALMMGAVFGYALARARRRRALPVPPLSTDSFDDETKPTLVPWRSNREQGRNLAKLNDTADR